MLRWSVHVLVVLCTITGTVNGTYMDSLLETDEDDDRRLLGLQMSALIQKIDGQEDRLQTLETMVLRLTDALAKKDRIIDRLVQELADMEMRVGSVRTSLDTIMSTKVEMEEEHHHELVTDETRQTQHGRDKTGPNQAEHYLHILAKRRPNRPKENKNVLTRQNQQILNQTRMYQTGADQTRQDQPALTERGRATDHHTDYPDNQLALEKATFEVKPETAEYARSPAIQHARNLLQGAGQVRAGSAPMTGYAFSVFLHRHTQVYNDRTIEYDRVSIDRGYGYQHATGRYVVPATGVYVFTWSTVSAENSGGSMITELMVDGTVIGATNADSDAHNWESATGLVVTSVNKGAHVYIRAHSTGRVVSSELARSTFSGWFLF